jgi:hypothetical protein
MIREYLERRKFRKTFVNFLSADAVEKLRSGEFPSSKLRQGPLEFVIVAVDGVSSELISERITAVTGLVAKHNGTVDCIFSSFVLIIYGYGTSSSQKEPTNAQKRLDLVSDLQRAMRDHVKIIHGSGLGHFGLLGGDKRFCYSFILPGFPEVICSITELKFGETKQIKLELPS